MSADPENASPRLGSPRARRHQVCRVGRMRLYALARNMPRHVNAATRSVLWAAFKLLVLAYFIFCALFLILRYGILPEIGSYKHNIEHIIARAIGRPVTIATIDASWRGLQPQFALSEVAIYNQAGQAALTLPRIFASLSWTSLLVGAPRFDNLTIVKPDLSIVRDAAGKWFIAGLPAATGANNSGAADWLLSQREIIIRDGKLRWRDDQRGAPELVLNGVNLVLRNHWRQHQLALNAIPPAAYAAPIDVRAVFSHPAFAEQIADFTRWKGSLYADLRETDLARWKAYMDYPFDIRQGAGAIRVWLDLDQARIANVTADLHLSHLSARLDTSLEPLQLVRVSGRIAASTNFAPDLPAITSSFEANGHRLRLIDFSLQTQDGFVLPSTTISGTFEPATHFHQEKIKIDAKLLDVALLSKLGARLPLPVAQRKLLADLAPRGQLRDFAVQWEGRYPAIKSYRLRSAFDGLGMQAQARREPHSSMPVLPGFINLSGQIDASDQGGRLSLVSQNGMFHLPTVLIESTLPFKQLNLSSHWQFQKNQGLLVQIDQMHFVLDGIAGSLSGSHLMSWSAQTPGAIDFKAHVSSFDLRKLARWLPLHTAKPVSDWIAGALLDGRASDIDMVGKLDLAEFPPYKLKTGVKSKSEFKLSGKFEGLKLNYAPAHTGQDGKSPEWPLLEDVKGRLSMNRARLDIHADSGQTGGLAVAGVNAGIVDLGSADARLEIDGSASGAMQNFLRYANNSPVAHWIGHVTEASSADGNARLALALQLPLQHLSDSKVEGRLQFFNNDIALLPGLPTVYRTNGTLSFNEKSFSVDSINGTFLSQPMSLAGGTQRDGSTLVKVDGTVTADGLRRAASEPVLQRLLDHLSGASRYTATVAVRQHQPEITIESSLQGMALDLPTPLQKVGNESWPLKVEIIGQPSADPLIERDQVSVSLGTVLSARYQRQKMLDRSTEWHVVSGGIGISQAAPQPDSGLALHANANTVNLDQWLALRAALTNSVDSREMQSNVGMNAYWEPDVIVGRANALLMMGKKLDNVALKASRRQTIWQADIASDQVTGDATWNTSSSSGVMGRVTARLTSLNIPPNAAADVVEWVDGLGGSGSTSIPALDIIAEDFQLFGKRLGRLELTASNARVGVGREWRIDKLALINADADLRAVGNWTTLHNNNTSNLTYALDINDAGKLLERFGFLGVVRGGKGKLDGDIRWQGLPFALDIPTLSGQLHMDIHAGEFLKVDPGAAKLLGVLNLQALPRRLALDFRDVFSQGFSFDNIVGTAAVAQGVVTTNNLKMTGVTASVLMSGSADIAQETQNLQLVVTPEINLGTASVVALAINPVVGVSSLLAQLFLRNSLMKSLSFEYNVTGSWRDPMVVKQERAHDSVGKPAAFVVP